MSRRVASPPKRARRSHSDREPVTVFECEADVLEGLERFAYAELSERMGDRVRLGAIARPGTLRFRYTGDLAALLDLHSVISIYLVRYFPVPRPKALLGHQHFEALIGLTDLVRDLARADTYETFRLSAAGEDSSVLTRLKSELAQRTGLSSAADEGDLLLRLRRSRTDEGWEVLIRISPRPLATRPWRVCNWPGALNATLAHSMVELTQPVPEDSVLNLCCGSGTLLVERLALCEARSAIGCDIDPAALACAGENLHAAGFAREATLEQWDAGQLPLADRSVSMICSDLPFGQLVGSHRENEQLYPRVLAETARVARPGARMVLLTHEVRLLDRVAADYAQQWSLQEVIRVRSGGMAPRVYLFRRLRAD